MSSPTQNTSAEGKKHQWSLDELRALHLLYGYYDLTIEGEMDDATDEANLIMFTIYNIKPSKTKSRTELCRSTYRERIYKRKTGRWTTIVRGPKEVNTTRYTNAELDDFRRVKAQIDAAAAKLGIRLREDHSRSPFGYAIQDDETAETVEAAEDAWTEAEKLEILFQIIAANNEKIPWDKIDMPEGRTLKAAQVMFDKEKAKVRNATKAKASADGNEEAGDETSAVAAEDVEAAADCPVNDIAALPTPSSNRGETGKIEDGGRDEYGSSENETEA